MRAPLAAVLLLATAVPAARAQDNIASLRAVFEQAADYVVRAAEKMPEEHIAFRPTDEVRTFGQIVGHVANTNYMICAGARGIDNPNARDLETVTAKAELVRAVRESFEFCGPAYDVPDARGQEPVPLFGRERPRMFALSLNAVHGWEHYGNLVTYMRLKGIVPPSSERE